MASMLFREMKGVNFSCASPASAAVCTSIDRRSMVRPTIIGRAIDRHTPHLVDPWRTKPKSSSKPKPYTQKSRKSSDHGLTTTTTTDLISPANSSRYLLDNTTFFDVFPALEPAASSLVPIEPPRLLQPLKEAGSSSSSSSAVLRPSSSARQHHDHQVVVLRVSLHCKGCEEKVRKHISKMEGVTSFDIDFAAKKVTVMGNVTPMGVLNSVSKVKNAQFWLSPPRSSASF